MYKCYICYMYDISRSYHLTNQIAAFLLIWLLGSILWSCDQKWMIYTSLELSQW
jgi:hypothetical protein